MSPSGGRKLEAAGCKVTRDDTSLVFLSVVCSFAHGLYGSCFSALAASIPQLAPQLNVGTSDFGMAYTCRGIGYLVGTLLSAYILQIPNLTLSKAIMACVSLIFIGITMFFIAFATSYYLVLFLFLIQGLGFGGMDMMVNCAVPELWGLRAQPWMQGLHTMFGIGSFVGPFFVGFAGYRMAFIVIAFCCFTPLGLLLLGSMAGAQQVKQKHLSLSSSEHGASEGGTSIEMTSVHGGLLTSESLDDAETGGDNIKNISTSDGTTRSRNEAIGSASTPSTFPLTSTVKYLTCIFYFVYTGCSAAFAAWITVYALEVHVTDSNADAAYLTSVFWLSMTVGRIIAIFVAVYLSSTSMLRIKLFQCVIACILLLLISDRSYASLVAVTIVFGYADSSIFPLGMTVLTDYGFEMDPSATLLFMVGTTMGEAILPAVFGFCVQYTSPAALPWLVTACCLSLIVVYFGVDTLGKKTISEYEKNQRIEGREQMDVNRSTKEEFGESPTDVSGIATFSPLNSMEDSE